MIENTDLNVGQSGWLQREVEMSKEHIKKTPSTWLMDQLSIERGSQELGGASGV